MKRQIDNPSPGAVTGVNKYIALTREVNLDTLSSDSSEEEIRDSGRPFQSLIVWGKKLDFVSSKIYDKRDDFDFDIVNFPFLDGDVPRRPSYGVYISQLIRFARVCSHVDDFNTRNKCLTAKLLKQGYRYHKLRKAFSKFYP